MKNRFITKNLKQRKLKKKNLNKSWVACNISTESTRMQKQLFMNFCNLNKVLLHNVTVRNWLI